MTALVYWGGPRDSEPVILEPGWPPPDSIGHVTWPEHHRYVRAGSRYVWQTFPLPPTPHA